jgi:hypothetical protein
MVAMALDLVVLALHLAPLAPAPALLDMALRLLVLGQVVLLHPEVEDMEDQTAEPVVGLVLVHNLATQAILQDRLLLSLHPQASARTT